MKFTDSYDIAIIGAGASGMTASINLAMQGKKICLIERQSRGGKKILASGNGHCNIGNLNINAKNYRGRNKELIRAIINNCSPQRIIEFFGDLGLDIVAKSDGKMYPKSMQASSVLALLEARVEALNIDRFFGVEGLQIKRGFSLSWGKNSIKAKNVIIATGSKAAPQLGG